MNTKFLPQELVYRAQPHLDRISQAVWAGYFLSVLMITVFGWAKPETMSVRHIPQPPTVYQEATNKIKSANFKKVDKAAAVSTAPSRPEVIKSSVSIGRGFELIKQCESGGNYRAINPAGYYGAYQFNITTWNSTAQAAGRGDLVGVRPDNASPADQDALAIKLHSLRGWQPWGCAYHVGLM